MQSGQSEKVGTDVTGSTPAHAASGGGVADGTESHGPGVRGMRWPVREPALVTRMALASGWCGSWARGAVSLIVLCLCVMLPGLFSLPPIDRDESRFAQASRQMMESGDYVVPRVQNRARINKPPLVYWLQCVSVQVFTGGDVSQDAIWMYRVPGSLCAMLSVLLTWRLGCSMYDPRVGWLAAALLAVCPLVVFDAHQARADQLLLTTVLASQYCLWRVLRLRPSTGQSWWMRIVWMLGLWVSVGLGVMAKGPITPLVAGLSLVFFCVMRRDWTLVQRVRPLMGLCIIAVMVVPWVFEVTERVGWATYWRTVWDETVGRSLEAKESHFGPPGYHLVLLVVLFFPGSLLTGMAVTSAWNRGAKKLGAWWRWRWIGKDAELFLLAWALPAWLIFELASTKLPHYTMPLYPALALLTARAALASSRSAVEAMSGVWAKRGYLVWGAVGVVMLAVVPGGAAVWLARTPGNHWQEYSGFCVAAAGLFAAIAATSFALRARPLRAFAIAGVVLALVFGVTLQLLVPANENLNLSGRIVALLGGAGTQGRLVTRPSAAVGYQEDSLIFLTRGRIEKIDGRDARDWRRQHPDGLMVVRKGDAEPGLSWTPIAHLRGFNYARTKWEDLVILSRDGDRPLEGGGDPMIPPGGT